MAYSPDTHPPSGFSVAPDAANRNSVWSWITQAARLLDQWGDRVPSFAFAIVVVALMLLSIRFAKGGFAHTEAEQYIPHYLSHRTLLQKVYDVGKVEVDATFYQPRVLSYMIDDLDVAFIAWSTRHGHPHFLSASSYVFWGGDCLLLWFYLRYRLYIDRWMAGLLICLLSTNPVLFTGVTYFRSAKAGAAFFLLCAFLALSECFRLRLRSPINISTVVLGCLGGFLLLCACLFDEIPVAFTLAAILVLGLECLMSRGTQTGRAAIVPLVTTIAVLLIYGWYDVVLHPRIAFAVTGQKIIFQYQSGMFHELLRQPVLTIIGSFSVFTDAFGYLVGGVSGFLGLVIMILLISAWRTRGSGQFREARLAWLSHQKPVIRVLAAGALMLGVLYGMLSRHPPIMWTDVRRGYYILPLSMVFFLFVAVTTGMIVRKRYLAPAFVQLTVLILAASNFVLLATGAVFNHTSDIGRLDMRSPAYTGILLEELRKNPADSNLSTNPEIARVQKQVLQSPVYKALILAKNPDSDASK